MAVKREWMERDRTVLIKCRKWFTTYGESYNREHLEKGKGGGCLPRVSGVIISFFMRFKPGISPINKRQSIWTKYQYEKLSSSRDSWKSGWMSIFQRIWGRPHISLSHLRDWKEYFKVSPSTVNSDVRSVCVSVCVYLCVSMRFCSWSTTMIRTQESIGVEK